MSAARAGFLVNRQPNWHRPHEDGGNVGGVEAPLSGHVASSRSSRRDVNQCAYRPTARLSSPASEKSGQVERGRGTCHDLLKFKEMWRPVQIDCRLRTAFAVI